LVKIFKEDKNTPYVYHIHLFENANGKRKAEYRVDGNPYNINRPGGYLKRTDLYQMQIYRWLQGRYDPDIPSYSNVPEDDTAVALRGHI